jgi:hypothetical protein
MHLAYRVEHVFQLVEVTCLSLSLFLSLSLSFLLKPPSLHRENHSCITTASSLALSLSRSPSLRLSLSLYSKPTSLPGLNVRKYYAVCLPHALWLVHKLRQKMIRCLFMSSVGTADCAYLWNLNPLECRQGLWTVDFNSIIRQDTNYI